MGLIDTNIEIEITSRNVTYYRRKGYVIKKVPCTALINSKDVNSSHTINLPVKCDYCGKEYTLSSKKCKSIIKKNEKFACLKCGDLKRIEHMQNKYGVNSPAQLPDFNEKVRNTSLEKYGAEHYTQSEIVKERRKEFCMEHYGVDNNFRLKECHEKAKRTRIKRYGNYTKFGSNGTTCYSKAQKHICDLLGAKLNHPCHGFFLDMLYEEWLDIEYNGGGHDLKVKLGLQTREEFEKQERKRMGAIKKFGYKQLIIEHKGRNLPPDEIIIPIIEQCIFFLKNFEDKILILDIDKKEIITFA